MKIFSSRNELTKTLSRILNMTRVLREFWFYFFGVINGDFQMIRVVFIRLAFFLFAISPSVAQDTAPDWKKFGSEYLTYNGQALTFDAADLQRHQNRLRCVKMNNYGCVMGRSWQGAAGNDKAGHAIFQHPKWSVRAVVRDYCSKNRRGLRSAMQIAETYSPWCDTLGTVGVRNGWGRSCAGGPQPPTGFKGPLCAKPANGTPAAGQCGSCNCPDGVARGMAASVNVGINDNLALFGADGSPNVGNLVAVLGSKFRRETGFAVNEGLIKEGIELAGQCR